VALHKITPPLPKGRLGGVGFSPVPPFSKGVRGISESFVKSNPLQLPLTKGGRENE